MAQYRHGGLYALQRTSYGAGTGARSYGSDTGGYMRVKLVSTWKCKCGIAVYTKHLRDALRAIGVEVDVVDIRTSREEMIAACAGADIIHLQSEPLFCRPDVGTALRLKYPGTPIVTTLHHIDTNSISTSIRFSNRLIILRPLNDGEVPNMAGLIDYIDMGTPDLPLINKIQARQEAKIPQDALVVATFGFLSGWKSISPVVAGLTQYMQQNAKTWLYLITSHHFMFMQESKIEAENLRAIVEDANIGNRVVHLTDFLPDDIIHRRLCAADAGFIYCPGHTGSSSAAARQFVAAGVPLVVTESNHFATITKGIHRTSFGLAPFIEGIQRVASDHDMRNKLALEMCEFKAETSWSKAAAAHMNVYRRVLCPSPQ